MNPPFSFRLRRKENGPFTVQKKRRLAQILPCRSGLGKTGVVGVGAVEIWELVLGCAWVFRNREGASPHLGAWERLSGVVDERPVLLAPRVPLRYALPGWETEASRFEAGRAAAAGRSRSNRSCTLRRTKAVRRGRMTGSFSKSKPAPNADADSTSQGLLLGPPYHKQIRHTVPFCAQAPFPLDRARPVSFSAQPKRKWGVHPPSPGQGTSLTSPQIQTRTPCPQLQIPAWP